ncbi:hypothetical protein K402DRAFT_432695 [Aulographum hederae CBS 113979]|uniref:Uncharacterized protein n=1 Tax=Aulographum hederae CBS 113979 TaxID=1176131 RepID=A0A6G1GWK5_9PEZI|nr:hypothetical protein K402DRAFT_432695 [Aulographum hederae CBS 113979]
MPYAAFRLQNPNDAQDGRVGRTPIFSPRELVADYWNRIVGVARGCCEDGGFGYDGCESGDYEFLIALFHFPSIPILVTIQSANATSPLSSPSEKNPTTITTTTATTQIHARLPWDSRSPSPTSQKPCPKQFLQQLPHRRPSHTRTKSLPITNTTTRPSQSPSYLPFPTYPLPAPSQPQSQSSANQKKPTKRKPSPLSFLPASASSASFSPFDLPDYPAPPSMSYCPYSPRRWMGSPSPRKEMFGGGESEGGREAASPGWFGGSSGVSGKVDKGQEQGDVIRLKMDENFGTG